MIYLWAAGLTAINAIWLALNLLALPGNWLMIATTVVVAWINWQRGMFSPWTLAVVFVLATFGELIELLAGTAGATRAGGGKGAAIGALLGGVVGAIVGTFMIPIPLIGSLVGAGGGACLGSLTMELSRGRTLKHSARVGLGAAVGRVVGTGSRLLLGVIIWIIIAVAAFWP